MSQLTNSIIHSRRSTHPKYRRGKNRHLKCTKAWRKKYKKWTNQYLANQLTEYEIVDLLVELVRGTYNTKAKWFYYMLCGLPYCQNVSLSFWDVWHYLQVAFQWNYLEEDDVRQEIWCSLCRNVFTRKKAKIVLILARRLAAYLASVKIFRRVHEELAYEETEIAENTDSEIPELFPLTAVFNTEASVMPDMFERYLCYLRYGCDNLLDDVAVITQTVDRQIDRFFVKIYDQLDVVGEGVNGKV